MREIYIYDDIGTDFFNTGFTAADITKALTEADGDEVTAYINSYGGSVSEGISIYNSLISYPAPVTTVVTGFACSIAALIFMSGDQRHMFDTSFLMLHNAFMVTYGNANEHREAAQLLDMLTSATKKPFNAQTDEQTVTRLFDGETWLTASDALGYNFATAIIAGKESDKAVASVRRTIYDMIKKQKNEKLINALTKRR